MQLQVGRHDHVELHQLAQVDRLVGRADLLADHAVGRRDLDQRAALGEELGAGGRVVLAGAVIEEDVLGRAHRAGQHVPGGRGQVRALDAAPAGPAAGREDDDIGVLGGDQLGRRLAAEPHVDAVLADLLRQPAGDAGQRLAPCRLRGDRRSARRSPWLFSNSTTSWPRSRRDARRLQPGRTAADHDHAPALLAPCR